MLTGPDGVACRAIFEEHLAFFRGELEKPELGLLRDKVAEFVPDARDAVATKLVVTEVLEHVVAEVGRTLDADNSGKGDRLLPGVMQKLIGQFRGMLQAIGKQSPVPAAAAQSRKRDQVALRSERDARDLAKLARWIARFFASGMPHYDGALRVNFSRANLWWRVVRPRRVQQRA